jgi:6-phosphofructokinase
VRVYLPGIFIHTVNSWKSSTWVSQHRTVGKRTTIVIVAEGACSASLFPIRAEYIKDVLTERLGLDTSITSLGHVQRGGRPCAFDRILVGLLIYNITWFVWTNWCRSRHYRAWKLLRR